MMFRKSRFPMDFFQTRALPWSVQSPPALSRSPVQRPTRHEPRPARAGGAWISAVSGDMVKLWIYAVILVV